MVPGHVASTSQWEDALEVSAGWPKGLWAKGAWLSFILC